MKQFKKDIPYFFVQRFLQSQQKRHFRIISDQRDSPSLCFGQFHIAGFMPSSATVQNERYIIKNNDTTQILE